MRETLFETDMRLAQSLDVAFPGTRWSVERDDTHRVVALIAEGARVKIVGRPGSPEYRIEVEAG